MARLTGHLYNRKPNRRQALFGLAGLGMVPLLSNASAPLAPAGQINPLPLRVPTARPDVMVPSSPSAVRIQGWLGHRVDLNAHKRLLTVDMEPFLAGYRQKPGSHPWIGEHVGKWIHAATLAWAHQGEPALRSKLDTVVRELISTQEPDGYLGTYVPTQRMGLYPGADWDVWSHKYNLMGLLTYHQYTGDAAALRASQRMADLLVQTFPARRSIIAAGTHRGLAATSVLEPIVLLYRITADERYLAFARYIVTAWDEPEGPALVRTLLTTRQVATVNPPKAYEMLSNLVGLVELARVTGEDTWVQACLFAWQDIVDKRLHITGGTSQDEHFKADHDLRDDDPAHVSEVCVTTTWIQFNMALLQLTGEARFAEEIERTTYNHLTAAQDPGGDQWCYFTPLKGRKRFLDEITCCRSSGPRGIALAPQVSYLTSRTSQGETLIVNTFEASSATLHLGGQTVVVEQHSEFPHRGGSGLVLRLARPTRFALKLRQPAWAHQMKVAGAQSQKGWLTLPERTWKDGDTVKVAFTLVARVLPGDHQHSGQAALAWGPFVLAYDDQANSTLAASHRQGLVGPKARCVSAPGQALRLEVPLLALPGTQPSQPMSPQMATLLPYADAGGQRGAIRVWLRAPGRTTRAPLDSLLLDGVPSCSRGATTQSRGLGTFNDDDLHTYMSTQDGTAPEEDWFAITMNRPIQAQQFAFIAGAVTPQGGWFDASAGKPRIQIRTTASAEWQTIGRLDDYPNTTATESRDVGNTWDLFSYRLKLPQPVSFVAVRIIGKPSGGTNPARPYVTCAELQAFA